MMGRSLESTVEGAPRIVTGMRSLTFATYLAPIMEPVYQWVTEQVGAATGLTTTLVVGNSYEEIVDRTVDVAFLCGWPYVRLADRPYSPVELLAAPVLAGPEHGGVANYCSRVIVRADSPFQSFADLRDCSWSFNEPASYSGYLATFDHLVQMGMRDDFFSRMIEAGWHEESVRMVRSGEIDASAIDCQVLDMAVARDPSLSASIRVLTTFRSAPIQPVVAGRHLPEAVRAALRQALLDIGSKGDRCRLAAGHVDRFVRIEDDAYDVIRERGRAVEAAGLL